MKHTKIYRSNFKKAQYIVELALIAPFIMFFIGVVYYLAVTIQLNYKFNASIYEAVSFIAARNKIMQQTELGLTEEQLKLKTVDNIKRYAQILLDERHAAGSSFDVQLLSSGDIDFLIGTYKHRTVFPVFGSSTDSTLQNYTYLTIIPVNSSVLKKNSFNIQNNFFDDEYEIMPENGVSDEDSDDDTSSDDEDTDDTDDTDDATGSDTESVDILEVHF